MPDVRVAEPLRNERAQTRLRAALISLAVAVLLFAVKFTAWRMTNSAAILSDALESIVNIVAAGMAAFSVWYASHPADEDHPYGHGKIEDFSAGAEGALIVLAALGILWSAVPRFFHDVPLEQIDRGVLLVVAAGIANLILALYLIREGRRHHSRALEADGKHVMADVTSSIGAVVGLGVVVFTGWTWVDPLVACAIAAQILVSGARLIRESFGRLMDEADEHVLGELTDVLREARDDARIDVHELRAWWAGNLLHVDFHLTLPRYWSLEQSATPVAVVVHTDPCHEGWCAECSMHDCPVRAAEFQGRKEWTRSSLVRVLPAHVVVTAEGR